MRPMKSPIMRPVVTMAAFIAIGAILWITLFSEQPVAYADSVKAAKEAMAGVRNLHATSTLTSKDGQHVTQAWLQTDPPRSRQEAFGYITIDDSVRQVTFHHEARVASKVEPSEVAQSLSLFQQDELLGLLPSQNAHVVSQSSETIQGVQCNRFEVRHTSYGPPTTARQSKTEYEDKFTIWFSNSDGLLQRMLLRTTRDPSTTIEISITYNADLPHDLFVIPASVKDGAD